MASSKTIPKLSPPLLGKTVISDDANQSGLSASSINPANETTSDSLFFSTYCSSSACNGPRPHIVTANGGTPERFRKIAAAWSNKRHPFLETSRPKNNICADGNAGRYKGFP